MTYTEKLQELWETSSSQGLGEILNQAVILIYKAHEEKEAIPLGLELDIVNTANYAMDYGSKPMQMTHILDLWNRCTTYLSNLENPEISNKIFRLVAIAIHTLLGNLMIDVEQNENHVIESINAIDSGAVGSIPEVIEYLFSKNQEVLESERKGTWKTDCLISQISLFSMLEELERAEGFDKTFSSLREFSSTLDQNDLDEKRVPNSDKYRFIHLMIFNTHPDEKRWFRNYARLME